MTNREKAEEFLHDVMIGNLDHYRLAEVIIECHEDYYCEHACSHCAYRKNIVVNCDYNYNKCFEGVKKWLEDE